MSTTTEPPPPPAAPITPAPGTKEFELPSPSDWTEFDKVDKHQNPWAVLIDYIKTVITLASGILGFSVTFVNALVGTAPSFWIVLFVALAWLCLIVTIALSLFAVGRITSYLRAKRPNTRPAPLLCNIAYFALGLALVLFAIAGTLRMIQLLNPTQAPKPQQTGYVKKLGEIGPFNSGSASLCAPKETADACDMRLNPEFSALPVAQLPHAPRFLILVGSADRERLAPAAVHLYGSNAGLARGRSEWVRGELLKRFPEALKSAEFISLFTGPDPFNNASQPRSEPDRRVEIWAGAE